MRIFAKPSSRVIDVSPHSFPPDLGRLEGRRLGRLCSHFCRQGLLQRTSGSNRCVGASIGSRRYLLTFCCTDTTRAELLEELDKLAEQGEKHQLKIKLADLRQLLYRAAGHLVKAEKVSCPLR